MKFYVLLLLAIYVVGCVGKPEKAYLLDSTNIEDMTNRKFDLSAQVRDWDYVVLEQNDSCCLTNISRLKIVGDDVFVVNVEAMQSDIYRFSIDGKFLNKIGQQGRDFGLVTNVVVDTFNNRVCLLDIIDRCVYLYDYDGKRVNGKIACPWVGWVMDAVACSKMNLSVIMVLIKTITSVIFVWILYLRCGILCHIILSLVNLLVC